MKKDGFQINEEIKVKSLLVIDEAGEKLGEMDTKSALDLANSKNLDLVLVSSNNGTNIGKILDYGKFIYEMKKKSKDSKKNQVIVKNKEIKVKPTIGMHDLMVRVNNAKKWLSAGNQIKFVVLVYGRIGTKTDMITEIYDKFIAELGDDVKVLKPLKQNSPTKYEALLVPNK